MGLSLLLLVGFTVAAALGGYWYFAAAVPRQDAITSDVEDQVVESRREGLDQEEYLWLSQLSKDPDNLQAHFALANLYGRVGRRREAIPHVIRLIQVGRAEDLLVLLAREKGIINAGDAVASDVGAQHCYQRAWILADQQQYDAAIEQLQESLRIDSGFAAAHLALGEAYAAKEEWGELQRLLLSAPQRAREFGEYWVLVGRLQEERGTSEGAIRCYAEALLRSAELRFPITRLAQLLDQADEPELAKKFAEFAYRLQQLQELQDKIFFAQAPSGIEQLLELINRYELVGRYWEALGWAQLAMEIQGNDPRVVAVWSRLQQRTESLSLVLTEVSVTPVAQLDVSRYPLPDLGLGEGDLIQQMPHSSSSRDDSLAGETSAKAAESKTRLSFREESGQVGLRFQYINGTPGFGVGEVSQRRMFEFTGGGIGVLDYDNDGYPDCFCSQGYPRPNEFKAAVDPSSNSGDRLWRNRGGLDFVDVSRALGIVEDGFGQGVSVGDYNADGFADLYIANIGQNRMLRNNGDGTFSDVTEEIGLSGQVWTTSCVVADLNGDRLPDIYDVNYVKGDDVFERVCRDGEGHAAICMPFDFAAESDRVWLNDGVGGFRDGTSEWIGQMPEGKGLGVVVFSSEVEPGLRVLVANDTTANFLFVPQSDPAGQVTMRERGLAAGVAYNGEGKAEGCMGIAAGDIDTDGEVDFLVTNFLNESNTLYLHRSGGAYMDRTRALGLHEPSLNMLGFGAQFLDIDLDGRQELVVVNGHIDDLSRMGRPYKMPMQVFSWRGRRFEEVDRQLLGDFFTQKRLGRAVAKWDWNRDGREDLLIGHLDAPMALLSNTTETPHSVLAIRFVGTDSDREAIGTRIEVVVGGQTRRYQLTAGDGYQASNERRLLVGIGSNQIVGRLTVHWPAGGVETFENVPTENELLIIEGRGRLFSPSRLP